MIKQFVPERVCLKCQGCCRFKEEDSSWSPTLLQEEVELLVNNKIPPSCFSRDRKIRLVGSGDAGYFFCALFEVANNACRVYPLRPLQCQLYPFLINRKEERVYLALDQNCPFMQDKLKEKDFLSYLSYLTDLFHNPLMRQTLKNNPQFIQAYPGILNLVEIKL